MSSGRHSHSSRTQRDPREDPRVDSRNVARDRDREMREPPRSSRGNEYFVPGDGIEREVIQSDICRYLGRDALVRPTTYQGRQGYLITAYRNLTSEMIDSLKGDSARFLAENRSNRAQGFRPVPYDQSETYADAYEERTANRAPTSQPFANYPPSSRQFEDERGHSPQYFGGASQAPVQQIPGHPANNYILSGQPEYGNAVRREYAPGNLGGQYPYDGRQDGYQPRTPQDDVPSTRAPVAYIPSHSGPQYVESQPSRGMPTGQTYIDPRTGQAVYIDAGYDVASRRTGQPTRSNDRDHRRMR